MWPTVFGLPARPVFIALAVALAIVASLRWARREGADVRRRAGLALLLVGIALIGLGGAKVDSLIERSAVEPLRLAVRPLLWEIQQGYRYPGGIIAVLVVVSIAAHLLGAGRVLALGDRMAPAAALAMAVVRLGCFCAGCCHGSVSGLPWAVSFPAASFAWSTQVATRVIRADAAASLPVHPLQLYFATWSLGLAVLLFWLTPRRRYAGQVLLAYVALDNVAKFGFEFLRDPQVPHLRWLSLVIGLAAAGFLLRGRLRGWKRQPERLDVATVRAA
jgi:phosphatidylglycerol---prolipoprotein diacylglyceryl transferase